MLCFCFGVDVLMDVKVKENLYIEINLTRVELDNIVLGRYPSKTVLLGGMSFVVSVGVDN